MAEETTPKATSSPSRGAKQLALWMRDQGVSQRSLAKALGVSNGAISLWLAGKRRPDAASRQMVADVASIDPAEWLTDDERKAVGEASQRLNNLVPMRRA